MISCLFMSFPKRDVVRVQSSRITSAAFKENLECITKQEEVCEKRLRGRKIAGHNVCAGPADRRFPKIQEQIRGKL